jgi:acyl carrier protein phosphodiesterase
MNFLAHARLSFQDPDILAGNMISDFVKGRKQFDLPPAVQQGILLHRYIDRYTDQHVVTKELSRIFQPIYGRYSPAIMDVLYDHFLATDPDHFSLKRLQEFSQLTYRQLEEKQPYFPETFLRMFPYMQRQDWLFNYRTREGIRQSLGGLKRRALYIEDIAPAFALFEEHYETIKAGYDSFFPDLYLTSHEEFLRLRGRENV